MLALVGGSAVAAVAALAACGSSATFDGARFEKTSAAYRVGELSPGWQRASAPDQDLAFTQQGRGSISVHALCEQYDDVPSVALFNHLLFGFTHRAYVLEEEVVLDGRKAHHAIVDAELDGVPVRVEAYIVTRNGCVFDLTYVSGRDASAHEEFTRFVRAFAIERTGGG